MRPRKWRIWTCLTATAAGVRKTTSAGASDHGGLGAYRCYYRGTPADAEKKIFFDLLFCWSTSGNPGRNGSRARKRCRETRSRALVARARQPRQPARSSGRRRLSGNRCSDVRRFWLSECWHSGEAKERQFAHEIGVFRRARRPPPHEYGKPRLPGRGCDAYAIVRTVAGMFVLFGRASAGTRRSETGPIRPRYRRTSTCSPATVARVRQSASAGARFATPTKKWEAPLGCSPFLAE
ncbi:hypothetical protein MRX96_058771 [Rhipicephalus microplus]